MKKIILFLLCLIMALSALVGCSTNAQEQNDTQYNTGVSDSTGTSNASQGQVISEITSIQADYSDSDLNSSYDNDSAAVITLNDDNTSIDGSGASYKDGVVSIKNAGTYVLSGSLNGQVIIEATSVDEVQIVLNNAEIINSNGTAIYVKQAEKVTITLADNSANTVIDGSSYQDTSDDAPDAAIYADDDLTINGSGTLTVTGNYKHGIKCSDSLTITSGNIDVTAVNDGIRGKDSVAILDGNITVDAGGDGITATNAGDDTKGWISVDGGTFNITAKNNGFQAESVLTINDGDINVTAGQDTYHCNYDILITNGTSVLDAGDDGMHADNNLNIAGGTIDVVSDYEGIEGSNVYITGGKISVEVVDDGINAAGGSDSDMAPGDRFSSQSGDNVISITGGDIYISCIGSEGDGLDSNGNIYLSGGTIAIDGAVSRMDAAIDINQGTFEYSGGTLTSVGGSSMLIIPTTVSQPVITVVFSGDQQAGKTLAVVDSSGNTVLSFTPEKTYSVAMLSSPELEVGETYSVTMNGNELFEITLDTTSITVDGSGNATAASQTGGQGGRGGRSAGGGSQGGRPGKGG